MDSNIDAPKLVQDVWTLINRYGITNVESAVSFLKNIQYNVVWYNPISGESIKLTDEQYNRLRAAYANGYGKISAIKLLREYTGIALRDAKELIEKYFQNT